MISNIIVLGCIVALFPSRNPCCSLAFHFIDYLHSPPLQRHRGQQHNGWQREQQLTDPHRSSHHRRRVQRLSSSGDLKKQCIHVFDGVLSPHTCHLLHELALEHSRRSFDGSSIFLRHVRCRHSSPAPATALDPEGELEGKLHGELLKGFYVIVSLKVFV